MEADQPRTDWGKGEVPVDACNHKSVHQFAGFNDYRDSQYKCEDCGAVSIVSCSPREGALEFGEVL